MKCIVIYFSQTGNTKKIAEYVHLGMSLAKDTSDIAFLNDVEPQTLTSYDLIGIGAPVWYGREPHNVTEFMENMPRLKGKYGFTFCTHGTVPGAFIARMVTALRGKGVMVSGWNDWFGSLIDSMGPKPYYTDGHPDEIDLNEAKAFGKEMIERTLRISEGESHLVPELLSGMKYVERYGIMGPPPAEGDELRIMEPKIKAEVKVDMEKCKHPKCSICKDNCPTQSIDPSHTPRHVKETCEGCTFCEQICPTGAIELFRSPHRKGDHTMFVEAAERLFELKELRRFRPLIPFREVRFEHHGKGVRQPPKLIVRDGVGVPRKSSKTEE